MYRKLRPLKISDLRVTEFFKDQSFRNPARSGSLKVSGKQLDLETRLDLEPIRDSMGYQYDRDSFQ